MKTKYTTCLLGIALLLLVSLPSAIAVPMLQLQSGTNTVTIADGDILDSSPMPGVITYIGAVGNSSINVTTGITKPVLGETWSPQMDLNSVDTSNLGGQLTLRFSDNDYTPVPPAGFIGAVGGTIASGGSASFKLYASSSNIPLDASAGAFISHGPFGSGAFSGSAVGSKSLTAPYSITLESVITHPPSANGIASSFDYIICASNAIVCPPDITLPCQGTNSVPPPALTIPEFIAQGGVVTSCRCKDLVLTHQDVRTGDPCFFTITRTYTVTDCDNISMSCVQKITMQDDKTPPVFVSCPVDVDLGCNPANIPVCHVNQVTVTDNCGPVTITCASVDTSSDCCKVRTLTYTATDGCANQSTCVQVITWKEDTTPPQMTCAADKTVECLQPWTFDPPFATDECVFSSLVFDNATNDLKIRFNPASAEIGDEIVLAGTARNLSDFVFEYYGSNSLLGYTFAGDVKARVRFYLNDGPLFSGIPTPGTVLYDSGPFSITATPRSTVWFDQTTLSTGLVPLTVPLPNTFTWTVQFSDLGANDEAGVDIYSPVVLGTDFPDYWEKNGGWQLKTNAMAAMDFAVQFYASKDKTDIAIVSTTTNALCGGTFKAARTWSATDPCGNRSVCTQTVTIVDTLPPTITSVPAGGDLGCNPPPTDASVKAQVTATDDCGGVPAIHVSHVDGGTACAPSRTFTITATDDCGNTSAPKTVVYTMSCSPCLPSTFSFKGSSSDDGTDGNIRVFTTNGISVKVSAFSRKKGVGGSWAKAWLGLYSAGLGVTDSGEDSDEDNTHTVDNIGRDNYVLFEFSKPVVVSRAYLGYVEDDSDLTLWLGTFADPFNNHLTLSDAVLDSFGYSEDNLTSSSSTRWADLNAGTVSANAVVIAAYTRATTLDDQFKIRFLDLCLRTCEPLNLACMSATSGQVGVTYSSALGASGGQAPYQFSITSGSLPPGLTLNPSTGAITGIPTNAGSFQFTATVTDALNATATSGGSECGITIAPPCSASICGVVLRDCDANGSLTGEAGLAGCVVILKNSGGTMIAMATTDANGGYCFGNLPAGTFTVVVTPKASYTQTVDPDSTKDHKTSVTLTTCQSKTGINFGYAGSAPSVNLVITGPVSAKCGDTITYTFAVTNTGNTCLYGGLSVEDPLLGGEIFSRTPVSPGEGFVFSKTYVVKSTDPNPLIHTATAIGDPPGSLDDVTTQASANTAITCGPELPSPWNTKDIGECDEAGGASFSNGTFTVTGSGANIYGSSDEFRYVYQTAKNNCSIVARVTAIENTDPWARAGVMIRETLNANSKHATVVLTPVNGVAFLSRSSSGGTTINSSNPKGLVAPYWIKVVRRGSKFTGYYSPDGTSWTSMGSKSISMSSSVYVGLCVTSHDDGTLCTATFDNVTAKP